jgi:phosphoglycolate phosphatase-like HAD superfamily hydrolase
LYKFFSCRQASLKEITLVAEDNKQVAVFDFDGVFVEDSEAVFKQDGWKVSLKEYEGRYEKHLAEAHTLFGHGKSGGRVQLMQYVFAQLGVPSEKIAPLVENTVQVFDDYVQAKILEVGLVRGALEALEGLEHRGRPIYLNSGTATPALRLSAHNLGVDRFFKSILGSTPEPVGGSKVENLQHVLAVEKVKSRKVLMIGDSDSDYQAALDVGCRFLGVANRHNKWATHRKPFPMVEELRDVSGFI